MVSVKLENVIRHALSSIVFKMEKRRQKGLSLKEKIEIINEVEKNPHKRKTAIADSFKIPPSTLTCILKNRDKIRTTYFESEHDVTKKRVRQAKNQDVDEALLKWFTLLRSDNVPVSGPLLKKKAEEFSGKFGAPDWRCNDAWLHRFKKRHGIVFKKMSGERESVDEMSTDAWVEQVLNPTLARYKPKDVFNADESGLFWRLLPDKTLAFKGEKCFGGKKSKERITFLVCANMDGSEKRPLFTIGRFQKPRCFAGVKSIPTKYAANKKAWMNAELFRDWLTAFDKDMLSQKRKVLLIVDNCTAHDKSLPLKATELLFLPPNATSKLQPLDQGIIQNVKVHYRTAHLLELIAHIDAGLASNDFKISLLDSLMMLKRAWDKVSPATISNCFKKAGFGRTELTSSDATPTCVDSTAPEPILSRLFKEWNVLEEDYFNVDADLQTSSHDIPLTPPSKPSVSATVTHDADSDDDDDCGEPAKVITSREVLACLQTLNSYCLQVASTTDSLTQPLSVFTEALHTHLASAKTQSTIPHFFQMMGNQNDATDSRNNKQDNDTESDMNSNRDVQTGTGVDTESDMNIQTGTGVDTESDMNIQTGTGVDTESDMNTQTGTGVNTESDMNTQTDTGVNTESDMNIQTGTGVNTESDMNTQTDTGVNTESDMNIQTGTGVNTESDMNSNAGVQTGTSMNSDIDMQREIGRHSIEIDEVNITGFDSPDPQIFTPTNEQWRLRSSHMLRLPIVKCLPFRPSKPTLTRPISTDKIKGDGNCFYRAVSLEICGTEDYHSEIRAQIVNFMIKNAKAFSQYANQNLNDYLDINKTTELTSWASDVEMYAAATLLQTTIVVYSVLGKTSRGWLPHHPLFPIFGSAPNKEKMYFTNLCSHFERVIDVV